MIAFILAMSIATLRPLPPPKSDLGEMVVGADGQPIVLADFRGNARDGSARQAMIEGFARLTLYMTAHHLRGVPGALPMASIARFDDETGVLTGAVAYAIRGTPPSSSGAIGIRFGETPAGRLVRFQAHGAFGRADSEYEDFVGWLSKHDLHPRSEAWEVYARQDGGDGPLTYVYYPLP